MKKALAVVLAMALIGVCTGGAGAQVPFVHVYFDADYNETQSNCLPPGTFSNLYVAALNLNMWVQAIDFKVTFPAALLYLGENVNVGPNDLFIGSSPAGLAIAYNLPQSGFQTILLTTILVQWTGACNCAGAPQAIVVVGYEPAINPDPTAVRWPDTTAIDLVGMTSLVCPGPVSTSTTTWGAVKALYR
jgi:hypothetical protein